MRITTPLAAVRTGARWSQDFVLQNADGTPRTGLAGLSPRVALVPQSQPRRAADSFALPAEHLSFWPDEARIGIRTPAEATSDYPLGDFAFEVQLVDGDDIESIAVGVVAIEQGLALVVDGQNSDAPVLAGSGGTFGTVVIKAAKSLTVTSQGPKGNDGHTPTDAELDALVAPRVAAALAAAIPTIPDPVLDGRSFSVNVAADTVLLTITDGIQPGALVSISPNDGRVKLVGNQQDGFRIVRGGSAFKAGDFALTIRQKFAPAINPNHAKTFQLMAMAADRYMFAFTRNRWNSGFVMPAAAGANYMASRIKFGSPQYAINDILLHFSGFGLAEGNTSPAESVLPGNDVVIDEVMLRVGGVDYPARFGINPGLTNASGAKGGFARVVLPENLPRDSDVEVITYWHVEAGQNYLGAYRIQKHRGEKVWQAASLAGVKAMVAADAPTSAAYDAFYNTVGNVTNSQLLAYGPDLMVAKGWDGREVVLMPADSIGDGRQGIAATADARGNMGSFRRLLDRNDTTRGRTPHFVMGVPGAAAYRDLTGAGATIATMRWDVMDEVKAVNGGANPWTACWMQHGRNDQQTTSAAWIARLNGWADRFLARYPGARLVGCTIPATPTSVDRWITTEGQTIAAPWTAALQETNAHIRALMGGRLAAMVDFFAYRSGDAAGKVRPGNLKPAGQVVATVGDGVTNFSQFVTSELLKVGYHYAVKNPDGTYTGATVAKVEGAGPYTITRQENAAVPMLAGAPIYEQSTPDGTHDNDGYAIDTVALIPMDVEKAKFAA